MRILKLKKQKSYRNKIPIYLKDVDIEKVLTSSTISVGEKSYTYFIGYLHNNHKFKPLNIMPSKTIAYIKRYDGQTKWMYFLIEDDDYLG